MGHSGACGKVAAVDVDVVRVRPVLRGVHYDPMLSGSLSSEDVLMYRYFSAAGVKLLVGSRWWGMRWQSAPST